MKVLIALAVIAFVLYQRLRVEVSTKNQTVNQLLDLPYTYYAKDLLDTQNSNIPLSFSLKIF